MTERVSRITAEGFSNTIDGFAKRKLTEVAHTCKITTQVQQFEDILAWEPSALNL